MTKNHFATLGLKAGASEDDVKKAYRNLAKKWHPDKNKETGAEDRFKEISAAYEYLKSEDRRDILARDLNRPKETKRTTKFESSSYKNGYSYAHSNTNTSEEPGPSRKFGQNSEDRYHSSSFGHFADEGKTSYSKPKMHQKSKKQSKPPPRKPWNHDWNNMDDFEEEIYDNVPFYNGTGSAQSRPNFSFAFKSFVDDLGMNFDAFFTGPNVGVFEFSPFFGERDPFNEFFSQESASPFSMDGVYRRPRKRNVADERGAEGLDPEFFFTPRFSSPSRSQSAHTMRAQMSSPDDDMDSRWFKCTYCVKRMPFSQLSTHEPGCALRRGGKFNMPDSDEEDDYEFSPEEDQYPHNTGDWRQTHEELLRNIRKAKKAAKSTSYRSGSATTHSTSGKEEPTQMKHSQVHCQWCGRYFSTPAAKQHIPFCEKWTKEHGTPLNPAGKGTARDLGSKSHRSREYAKHIPRPRDKSKEDSNSPTSPRSHYDHFPDINSTKRDTMNKAGVSSGTGLHASDSYSPRGYSAPPEYSYRRYPTEEYLYAGKSYTPKTKVNASTRLGSKYTQNSDKPFTNPLDDSYSFNISGTKIKTDDPSKHTETCRVCKKRIRGHARLTCNCGIRKTGA